MKTTLGGDRLGAGNKQEISMRNYERSTHDLSSTWRSSMSAGTLVPFFKKLALPGDRFEINLNCEVLTLPTTGPLFGSYKVQLDIFETPMRLYNAKLHMNKLGIGMDMSSIYLPQLVLRTNNHADHTQTFENNEQINPSSLIKYLGVSGLGKLTGSNGTITRDINAIPLLCYWDIYKNYYSNKQEEVGYYIHTSEDNWSTAMTPNFAELLPDQTDVLGTTGTLELNDDITVIYPEEAQEPKGTEVKCELGGVAKRLKHLFASIETIKVGNRWVVNGTQAVDTGNLEVLEEPTEGAAGRWEEINLEEFDLSNIDDMREDILQFAGAAAFEIVQGGLEPYSCFMTAIGDVGADQTYSVQYSQEGLGIKTYQSDLFNNWIDTDWIDGANGVNEITSVDTTGDNFTIDALNLAQKVYIMLNRIAISGGTYDDWLDAVYTHERTKSVESPVYHGSLIKELGFEEVISQAETKVNDELRSLGTLAGRGRMTSKHKGGRITINVNEPSYIMGIVSLTPRVEYSQGNDWDINLTTYDDLHKPALDAIGFQDLITEQMLWTDSTNLNGVVTHKSLGKQPAWINYMTEVNKCYGNFADENKEMYMVLNRRYEAGSAGGLVDGSTYIDPTKFNQIFAETNLDAQNFWVHIGIDCIARRKMSAKVIPNL